VFYLDYVLGPESLSYWSLFGVHSFYRTGNIAATQSIAGETPPTKRKLLEGADPWIGSADFYVCFIGRP